MSFGFFLVGELFDHTLSLLQARRRLGSFKGLACQTTRANPSPTLTPPPCLIQHTGLSAKSIVAPKANYVCRRIQDLQVLSGSNVPHGFATDRHAVLESFFGPRDS